MKVSFDNGLIVRFIFAPISQIAQLWIKLFKALKIYGIC